MMYLEYTLDIISEHLLKVRLGRNTQRFPISDEEKVHMVFEWVGTAFATDHVNIVTLPCLIVGGCGGGGQIAHFGKKPSSSLNYCNRVT